MHLVKLAQRRLRSFWKINMCLTLKKPQEVRRSHCQFLQLRFGWTLMDFDGPWGQLSRRLQQLTWIQCSQAVLRPASESNFTIHLVCMSKIYMYRLYRGYLRRATSSFALIQLDFKNKSKSARCYMQCLEIAWIVFAFDQVHQNLCQGCKEVSWLWLFLLRRQRPFCQDHQHRMPGLFGVFLHFCDIRDYTYPLSPWITEPRRTFHLCPSNHWESLSSPISNPSPTWLMCWMKTTLLSCSVWIWVSIFGGEVSKKNQKIQEDSTQNLSILTKFAKFSNLFDQNLNKNSIKVHQGVHCSTPSWGSGIVNFSRKKPPMAKSTMASCIYTKKQIVFRSSKIYLLVS